MAQWPSGPVGALAQLGYKEGIVQLEYAEGIFQISMASAVWPPSGVGKGNVSERGLFHEPPWLRQRASEPIWKKVTHGTALRGTGLLAEVTLSSMALQRAA